MPGLLGKSLIIILYSDSEAKRKNGVFLRIFRFSLMKVPSPLFSCLNDYLPHLIDKIAKCI